MYGTNVPSSVRNVEITLDYVEQCRRQFLTYLNVKKKSKNKFLFAERSSYSVQRRTLQNKRCAERKIFTLRHVKPMPTALLNVVQRGFNFSTFRT